MVLVSWRNEKANQEAKTAEIWREKEVSDPQLEGIQSSIGRPRKGFVLDYGGGNEELGRAGADREA